jgi:GWxTD domain-containing protein
MKKCNKWLVIGSMMSLFGCSKQAIRESPDPLASYNPAAVAAGTVRDFGAIYRKMGLVAAPAPIAFVGSTAYFATPSPDTTLAVVSMSFPNRGLTFEHDGDQYKATYSVTLVVMKDTTEIRRLSGTETVRVGTFKETSRTDESIIFRQAIALPPGQYSLAYRVRDVAGAREAAVQDTLTVPRMTSSVSTPVVVYDATPRTSLDSIPSYLASPRASVIFGVDSAAMLYLESYGGHNTVALALSDDQHRVVWRDTVHLQAHGTFASGTATVPFDQADIGILSLTATPLQSTDTAHTAIFVGFGPDLPVLSFGDMVDYLRYFASGSRLQALRDASSADRGRVWATFLRETDQSPDTPQNEALLSYFARIQDANYRFRSDATEGWLSDRGSVFVGLGEPDAVYDDEGYLGQYSINPGQRVRVQIWEYRDLQARLVFYDETGAGQWRMTPSTESQFRLLLARVLSR